MFDFGVTLSSFSQSGVSKSVAQLCATFWKLKPPFPSSCAINPTCCIFMKEPKTSNSHRFVQTPSFLSGLNLISMTSYHIYKHQLSHFHSSVPILCHPNLEPSSSLWKTNQSGRQPTFPCQDISRESQW